MADELNANGFRKVYSGNEYDSYENNPKMRRLFMMGLVCDPQAMKFLKEQGLLENGRCPSCGAPMSVYRYTWYDTREPSRKFYVCYGCASNHGNGDGHSMDGCPQGAPKQENSGTGCMLALLFMPYYIIKSFLSNLI